MVDKKTSLSSYVFINFIIFSIILVLQDRFFFIPYKTTARLIIFLALFLLLLIFFILDVSSQQFRKLARTKHRQEVVISGHVLMLFISILFLYSECKILFDGSENFGILSIPPPTSTSPEISGQPYTEQPMTRADFIQKVNKYIDEKIAAHINTLPDNLSFAFVIWTLMKDNITYKCINPILQNKDIIENPETCWNRVKQCIDDCFVEK